MKNTEAQVRAVNAAFENMARELKRFNETCIENNSPIRGVSLRVKADGNTKIHVTYKKAKSKL